VSDSYTEEPERCPTCGYPYDDPEAPSETTREELPLTNEEKVTCGSCGNSIFVSVGPTPTIDLGAGG
jgi:DNA-directed RNA polymerase subunit RPC12/RpoP